MFITSIPGTVHSALVSDEAVFPIAYREALRVADVPDVPYRSWHDLDDATQYAVHHAYFASELSAERIVGSLR